MTKAQLLAKLDKGYEGGARLMGEVVDLKGKVAELQRGQADRDHLIRELAEELERMAEAAPLGTDIKPAARLYNRAQDLVGWKDGD